MQRSDYKVGEYLVTVSGKIFIHDGTKNGDGYGVIIGEDSYGVIKSASGKGNWMKHPIDHIATEEEREKLHAKIRKTSAIGHY